MTDLTEQWKKGELPAKDDKHQWLAYYIKHKDGHIHADSRFMGQWGIADSDSIEQILAPVPSYEEWQASYNCMLENEVLRLKNAKLKELLKECETPLKFYNELIGNKEDLLQQIDEVLK